MPWVGAAPYTVTCFPALPQPPGMTSQSPTMLPSRVRAEARTARNQTANAAKVSKNKKNTHMSRLNDAYVYSTGQIFYTLNVYGK